MVTPPSGRGNWSNEMPECKKCEGSGSIVIMSDGSILPFYKATDGSVEVVKRCDVCDGYGRVTETSAEREK